MYPLSEGHDYVRDTWYVAALSHEISGDEPLYRRILDEPVVLYRDEGGRAVALYGLCPHRRLPLAMGRIVGGEIQCGYHGIRFGADGRCTHVPSQPRPSEQLSVKAYPCEERWNFVWVWTGDPDRADAALIPDHDAMGLGEGWVQSRPERYAVPARYMLMIDNLLDLSHISFLHGSYIEDEAWFATPVTFDKDAQGWIASRRTRDSARSKFHDWMFENPPERLDQDLKTVFLGPSIIYSGPVLRQVTTDCSDGELVGSMLAIHAVTPETRHSCHYFSTTTRDFRLDDAAMTEELHTMDMAVRNEDVVALSAIEAELSRGTQIPPEVSVKADTPALRVRRMIDEMIAAEKAGQRGIAPRQDAPV